MRLGPKGSLGGEGMYGADCRQAPRDSAEHCWKSKPETGPRSLDSILRALGVLLPHLNPTTTLKGLQKETEHISLFYR